MPQGLPSLLNKQQLHYSYFYS